MTTVLVNGAPLHYVHAAGSVRDRRPPLILVHGAGGNLMHWPRALRRFQGRSVYALDLPGHGHSDGRPSKDIGGYAESLRAFCEALSLPPAIVCGHSMGGAIALEFALRYPGRVAALILVATGARLPVSREIISGLASDPRSTTEKLARWALGAQPELNLSRLHLRRLREVPIETLRNDFEACDAFDRRADLSRVSGPVLVLWGDADRMTPAKLSSELVDGIPGARPAMVHGAGHMVMLEAPDSVEAKMQQFVDALSEESRAGR